MSWEINKYIDHTVLKNSLTKAQVDQVCAEARDFQFKAVCIPPAYVAHVSEALRGTEIGVCTVINFPFGYQSIEAQLTEIDVACKQGATEIDVVAPLHRIVEHDWKAVETHFEILTRAVHEQGVCIKWILETCLWDQSTIEKLCRIAINAEADFVKTSTGFSEKGAEMEKVRWMLAICRDHIQLKASGGIRSREQALSYLEMGVSRIGTSSGCKIIIQ